MRFGKAFLEKGGVDAAVLFNSMERPDSSFVYATGLRRVTGCLLVTPEGSTVFVSPLEYVDAKKKSLVKNVKVLDENFYRSLGNFTKGKVGLNFDYVTVNGLTRLQKMIKGKCVDVSALFREMRMIKQKEEVKLIEKACTITDKIYSTIFRDAKSVKTEYELKKMIEEEMRKYGTVPSFDTIVASGKNSAVPHHQSGATTLKGLTVIDMGVCVKEYCSDLTRTMFFGKPTAEEKSVYEVVKRVQASCLQMIREGEDYAVIHRYAAQHIGKDMIHSVGHGLGIDVHEQPFIRQDQGKIVLKKGMVITIEPGMYLPHRFGVRIEDDVVVEKDKGRVLSKTTKELVVV